MAKLMYVVGVRVLWEAAGTPGATPTPASFDAFLARIDALLPLDMAIRKLVFARNIIVQY